MEPIFLTIEEVLEIHRDQIQRYGGAYEIRDIGLLVSATAMPSAGFGDQYLHKDIFEMAAAYLFHVTQNHPFVDGNNRVGGVVTGPSSHTTGHAGPHPAVHVDVSARYFL